jgi:plastocyanin
VITVVIGVNNTVTWINQDEVTSSIISSHNYNGYGFGSPILFPGDKWKHTFTKSGIYEYHSAPHPWKHGEIIVVEHG